MFRLRVLFSIQLITICLVQYGTTANRFVDVNEVWEHWKYVHGRTYEQWEEGDRFETWLDNVAFIQAHNLRYQLGLEQYGMAVNEFADLTWAEFVATYRSGLVDPRVSGTSAAGNRTEEPIYVSHEAPDSVDWRQKGLVRRVKDQKNCGSCWAFSTTGVIEGQFTKRYGQQLEFSEQQLVDCSRKYGNHGCNGGLMTNSYKYLKTAGLESETDYPYLGNDTRCSTKPTLGVVKVQSFRTLTNGSETGLMNMVAEFGPIAVGIDADDGFQFYRTGIYTSTKCSKRLLNHAVLVVGYNSEGGTPYWIVKNSWGSSWGEDGYIRMARNRNNMCGIASLASVPQIVKTK
ncbi:unnamed protein product [Echinostoma caproni]|uniref:Cathepsin L n=1 Tax=Echinostoma caproni TaxID=27848 RepID=A0A183AGL5_9TREM|nr:unnamed protein product [Echinostoma caproni]